MKIYHVSLGIEFDVEHLDPNARIDELKQKLAPLSRISPNDQILLLDGKKLETNQTLGHYGSSSEHKIFLFDRTSLSANAEPPTETRLGPVQPENLTIKPLETDSELKKTPLVWSLIRVKHHFNFHVERSVAIQKAIEKKLQLSQQCVAEQQIQEQGLAAVIKNVSTYFSRYKDSISKFKKHYQLQLADQSQILSTFEEDIELLRSIAIHPSLKTSKLNFLIDCGPEDGLIKWKTECESESKKFSTKLQEFDKRQVLLQESVSFQEINNLNTNFDMLNDQLGKIQSIMGNVTTQVQMFSNDHNNVKIKTETALQQSQPQWELLSGYEEMSDVHNRKLAEMEQWDIQVSNIMNEIARSKTLLSRSISEQLKNIARIQSQMSDESNYLIAFNETLNHVKSAFDNLGAIRKMPASYNACLDEIVRRKSFDRFLKEEVLLINKKLAGVRKEENFKRSEFLKAHYRFIPQNLFPGISETVPSLTFGIPIFDSKIPSLSSSDEKVDINELSLSFGSGSGLSVKLEELQNENQQLKEKLDAENEQYKQQLQNSIGLFTPKVTQLEQEKKELEESINTLKPALDELKGQNDSLQEELEHSVREFAKIEDLEEENDGLKKKMSDLESSVLEMKPEIEVLRSANEELSKSLAENQSKLESLDSENNLVKTDLEKAVGVQSQLEGEVQNTVEKLKAVETENNVVKENLDNETSLREELEEQYSRLETELQEKSSLLTEEQQVTKKLEAEYSVLKEKLEEESAELEKHNSSRLEIIEREESERKRIERENSNLLEEKDKLSDSLALYVPKIEELEKQKEDLEKEKNQLMESISSFRPQIDQLTQEKEQLENELNQSRVQFLPRIDELVEENSGLKKEIEDNVALFANFDSQIKSISEEKSLLQRQLDDSRTMKMEWEQKLKTNERILKEENEQLQKTNKEKQALQNEAELLKQSLTSQEKNALKIEQENDILKSKLSETSQKVAEQENLMKKLDDDLMTASSNNGADLVLASFAAQLDSVLYPIDHQKSTEPDVLIWRLKELARANSDNVLRIGHAAKSMTELGVSLKQKEGESQEFASKLKAVEIHFRDQLKNQLETQKMEYVKKLGRKLALSDFTFDEIVCFYPNPNSFYEAININAPNFFLSPESLETFKLNSGGGGMLGIRTRPPIIGQIVQMIEGTATAGSNPYRLSVGTVYHEVIISQMNKM